MSPLSPFALAYGRLVAAYRAGPKGAAEATALLREVVALVSAEPAVVEAGLFLSGEYDITNLRSHLLRRQVEVLTIGAGAPAELLESLARALGSDAPLPAHPAVTYEMVAPVVPVARDTAPPPAPPVAPPPVFLMGADVFSEDDDRAPSAFGAEVSALTDELGSAQRRGAWMDALHAAQALVRLSGRVPEMDRRTVAIRARRALSRPLLAGIIEYAIRTPEEQSRAAEVLQWRGGDAAELMLEAVRKTESPEPHRFLLDALARMPDAVPLLLPMLDSPRWHEARHAADVLGRQMVPEALPALRALLARPEPRLRGSALEALARYPAQHGAEALREGLGHSSPDTRRDAAAAIGRRGGGALAMPLLAAIEAERDHGTWRTMVTALARIEAPEAAAAMTTLALRKRGFLSRGGLSLAQRLEVVSVLALSPARAARQALTRVAREAEGEVGAAARGELDRRA